MRKIITYKLFEDNTGMTLETYFKDKINYDLIYDLKELSLNILDAGKSEALSVAVCFEDKITTKNTICTYYCDSDGSEFVWNKDDKHIIYYIIGRYEENGLYYFFDHYNEDIPKISVNEMEEIESIIQSRYPNENVKWC